MCSEPLFSLYEIDSVIGCLACDAYPYYLHIQSTQRQQQKKKNLPKISLTIDHDNQIVSLPKSFFPPELTSPQLHIYCNKLQIDI